MKSQTYEATLAEGQYNLFLKLDGLILEIKNQMSGKVSYEVDDNTIDIDMNETVATPVEPWNTPDFNELDTVTGEITIYHPASGDTAYLKGSFNALPIAYPFYGATDEGQVYQINLHRGSTENDHILGVEETSDDADVRRLKNMETEWARPVSKEKVSELFESELNAVIPI